MAKIKILVDSSVDLPQSYFDENNIDIIRYNVNLEDKSYRDGLDITTKEMFKIIDRTKALPKTSAIGPTEFEEIFRGYSNNNDEVIFIGLGSGFSSSLSSAVIGSQEFDNVYVIDSGNLSSGTGLLVFKIMKYIKEGLSAKEITEKINALVPLVRTQFCIDTLKYLHMGGRCKATAKYFASALHIKPIIAVRNGKMEITKKPIGYKKALDIILDQVREEKANNNIDLDCILVTHPMAEDDAKYLKEELYKMFDKEIILETRAGGTVATHCGPRTIGILYIAKQ